MMRVLGADGARVDGRSGWIAALVDDELLEVRFVDEIADAIDAFEPEVLAVDVPIGHEDPQGEVDEGRRRCDIEARKRLGDRSSSVFATPPIDLLEASEHEDAIAGARDRGVIAPSIQVWGLRSRVLEVRDLVHSDPRPRVVETHPEVSFTTMGEAIGEERGMASKRSFDGVMQRLHRLASVGLEPGPVGGDAGTAPPHDVVDAVACAWTAGRVASGTAICIPRDPPVDLATGREVAIRA
jgi:predicted RNase H-like nuclease